VSYGMEKTVAIPIHWVYRKIIRKIHLYLLLQCIDEHIHSRPYLANIYICERKASFPGSRGKLNQIEFPVPCDTGEDAYLGINIYIS